MTAPARRPPSLHHGRERRRPPDFFIVGQPKSGTTALYEMLCQHPQIFMSDPKEPNFLAPDMRLRFQPRRAGPEILRLEDYLALFATAEPQQLVGEASPLYILSQSAAAEIASLNSDARIIALFREPAAFLRSFHLQLLEDHCESVSDLRRAVALEPRRSLGERIPRRSFRPQMLRYSQHVRYTDQLRRFHAVLPPEQVHVLLYDDFRGDNEGTVRGILRFLDVDDSVPISPVHANPTVGTRSQILDDAVHRVSVGVSTPSRIAKRATKALIPQEPRRRLLSFVQTRILHPAPPPPDPIFMAELRARFRPEVERFGEYIGRDLVTLWGYEDD